MWLLEVCLPFGLASALLRKESKFFSCKIFWNRYFLWCVEAWQSGWMHWSWKPARVNALRGFESYRLRHFYTKHPLRVIFFGKIRKGDSPTFMLVKGRKPIKKPKQGFDTQWRGPSILPPLWVCFICMVWIVCFFWNGQHKSYLSVAFINLIICLVLYITAMMSKTPKNHKILDFGWLSLIASKHRYELYPNIKLPIAMAITPIVFNAFM